MRQGNGSLYGQSSIFKLGKLNNENLDGLARKAPVSFCALVNI